MTVAILQCCTVGVKVILQEIATFKEPQKSEARCLDMVLRVSTVKSQFRIFLVFFGV
jgi:hypothetical protein